MPQGKAVVSLCTNRAVTVNPENEYIDHFEFLNNLASIGVSLHELKVGVVVILLQNLNTWDGLSNWARLRIRTVLPIEILRKWHKKIN